MSSLFSECSKFILICNFCFFIWLRSDDPKIIFTSVQDGVDDVVSVHGSVEQVHLEGSVCPKEQVDSDAVAEVKHQLEEDCVELFDLEIK